MPELITRGVPWTRILLAILLFAAFVAFTLFAPLVAHAATSPPDPALVLSWAELLIGLVVALAPLIIAFIKLTGWGKANREALDQVVDAVGSARRSQLPAESILGKMKRKENDAPPRVVQAWKKAVRRRDPKKRDKRDA